MATTDAQENDTRNWYKIMVAVSDTKIDHALFGAGICYQKKIRYRTAWHTLQKLVPFCGTSF